jgi:hypothetical protein
MPKALEAGKSGEAGDLSNTQPLVLVAAMLICLIRKNQSRYIYDNNSNYHQSQPVDYRQGLACIY